jgi:hypothetical protein
MIVSTYSHSHQSIITLILSQSNREKRNEWNELMVEVLLSGWMK